MLKVKRSVFASLSPALESYKSEPREMMSTTAFTFNPGTALLEGAAERLHFCEQLQDTAPL